MKIKYIIGSKPYVFDAPNDQQFTYGENIVLSTKSTDLLFDQMWYKDGYSVFNVFNKEQLNNVFLGITHTVKRLIENLNIDTSDFKLEDYHHYIKNDDDHFNVVNKTRDLFSEHFNFDILDLIYFFENKIGIKLSDKYPKTGERWHIIIRINRPHSNDFNPPHQDFDDATQEPMVNVWMPICGVDDETSLCIVKGSHLIPMSKIEKSVNGGALGTNKYRVRMIKSWGDSNELSRININQGEVLFFTPFLIHGMAYNNNDNKTRVALEFRLFKRE